MKRFDAIVTPTEPMVACEVGEQLMKFDDLEQDVNLATGRYVGNFNLVGLPGICSPRFQFKRTSDWNANRWQGL